MITSQNSLRATKTRQRTSLMTFKSKKNEATDIIDDFMTEDNVWIIFFEENERLSYEVQFKVDKEGNKTLTPVKGITWEGGDDAVITDVQKVKVTVK